MLYLSQLSSDLLGLIAVLSMVLIGFVALTFWLWILAKVLENPKLKPFTKFLWVFIMLTTYFGAVVYFFIHKPNFRSKKSN
jgi:Na+/H+-dicarboxylate symporter